MTPVIISVVGVGVSIVGLLITIYTIVKTNAKNQQAVESRLEVIDVKIQNVKEGQETLSKRVEKHNNVIERTYRLEEKVNEDRHDIVELKTDVREVKNHIMKG